MLGFLAVLLHMLGYLAVLLLCPLSPSQDLVDPDLGEESILQDTTIASPRLVKPMLLTSSI